MPVTIVHNGESRAAPFPGEEQSTEGGLVMLVEELPRTHSSFMRVVTAQNGNLIELGASHLNVN